MGILGSDQQEDIDGCTNFAHNMCAAEWSKINLKEMHNFLVIGLCCYCQMHYPGYYGIIQSEKVAIQEEKCNKQNKSPVKDQDKLSVTRIDKKWTQVCT
jgi:hypothetical protein